MKFFILFAISFIHLIAQDTIHANIVQIQSSQHQKWENVSDKKITKHNHGGVITQIAVDVYAVPEVKPNYITLCNAQGHYLKSQRIEKNGYIIGYRHFYKLYEVDMGKNSQDLKVYVNDRLADVLVVK